MASDSIARTFEIAIKTLKQTISPTDAITFQSTSAEDVWKAAEEIEESQRKRRSLRAMKRIEPFLKGLEKYSKAIEVLCNGTPYLPWIWVSVHILEAMPCAEVWLGSDQIDAAGKQFSSRDRFG